MHDDDDECCLEGSPVHYKDNKMRPKLRHPKFYVCVNEWEQTWTKQLTDVIIRTINDDKTTDHVNTKAINLN